MTEIGFVPEDWEESTIKEHCQIMTGGTPNTKVHEYWEPLEIPWMKSGEIQGNRITSLGTFISKKGLENSNARWLPKKSVVIALAGRGKARGTTAMLETDCTCNQSVVGMVPDNKISYEYLHYFLSNIYGYIRRLTGDKDRSGLNKQIIGNIPFFYPPLPEQQKIASILSTIQTAKEKTENIIKATKELKKSMMKHLFTYGSVPVEDAEKVPLKETEIGMIPEHWGVNRIKGLGEVITGTTPSTKNKEYYGEKYQFISPSDLGNTKYIYSTGKYLSDKGLQVSRVLPKDTVLVTCIGSTIGKTGMTFEEQSSTNQQINSIICSKAFNAHFIYYYLTFNADMIKSFASTVAIPILNKSNFEEIMVISPTLNEQQQIAVTLSVIDTKIEAEETKKQALDTLFKTLLSLLMTGKLRVKDVEIPV